MFRVEGFTKILRTIDGVQDDSPMQNCSKWKIDVPLDAMFSDFFGIGLKAHASGTSKLVQTPKGHYIGVAHVRCLNKDLLKWYVENDHGNHPLAHVLKRKNYVHKEMYCSVVFSCETAPHMAKPEHWYCLPPVVFVGAGDTVQMPLNFMQGCVMDPHTRDIVLVMGYADSSLHSVRINSDRREFMQWLQATKMRFRPTDIQVQDLLHAVSSHELLGKMWDIGELRFMGASATFIADVRAPDVCRCSLRTWGGRGAYKDIDMNIPMTINGENIKAAVKFFFQKLWQKSDPPSLKDILSDNIEVALIANNEEVGGKFARVVKQYQVSKPYVQALHAGLLQLRAKNVFLANQVSHVDIHNNGTIRFNNKKGGKPTVMVAHLGTEDAGDRINIGYADVIQGAHKILCLRHRWAEDDNLIVK